MATWHRQPTGDSVEQTPGDETATVVWVAADHLTPKAALADAEFPVARNDPHPDYGLASLLRARRVRVDATQYRVMTVTAEYGIPRGGSYQDEPSLTKPLVFTWQTVQESVAIDRDLAGNAILTSARRSVDGINQTRNAKRLTVTRWESSYTTGPAFDYENSVNDGPFEGAAAQEVRCEVIQPSTSYEADADLLPIDYVFLFKPSSVWGDFPHQTWFKDIDSAAYATYNGKTARRRLLTPEGDPLSDIPLDGTGQPLKPNEVTHLGLNGVAVKEPVWASPNPATPPGATIVDAGLIKFLRFDTCPEKNFSALSF